MKKKILWITGLLIASGVVIAQVPNTFSPGDSLSSSKLNQNFTYLTKLVKDGAGNTLGQLIGATSNEIDVMTSTGYHYGITTNVATGNSLY